MEGTAARRPNRKALGITLLGVFLLSILESLLIFLDAAIQWKFIVIGAVVIVNTALTRWQSTGERGTSG